MREFAGKHVLILVENLPSPFDHRVWLEACALRDRGARVTIVCPKGPGYRKGHEKIDGIDIFRHPVIEARRAAGYLVEYSLALLCEFLLCAIIFLRRRFHVMHICNPPDLLFLIAAPYKYLAGVRVVFDHHDINPELVLAKFGRRGPWYRLMLALERRTFRTADLCIATNESYRRIALTRGGRKPDLVTVVRSGPSVERMKIMAPVPILKNGRRILVAYVGVIGRQEGLTYLVDSCAYLVETQGRKDIQFIVVGSGPDLPVVKGYTRRKGMEEYFTFPGRVPDRELLEALNTADICVNTDEYNEMNDKSTMNKIMEYMALKKPIVQFDLTEGRVSAGEASLYARPNDAQDLARKIVELADDPEKRKRMGEIGYERIRTCLSWDYQKEHLYKVYRGVFLQGRRKIRRWEPPGR